MCTGRIDLEFIFKAFANGVDGVFIGGCRLNECNYLTQGNYDAFNTAHLARRIMQHIGLNPERLSIKFMTSGEGNVFAESVDGFIKHVREMGPLGKGEGLTGDDLKAGLDNVLKLIPYIKIEKRKKLASRLNRIEDYDKLYTVEEIDQLFNELISYYIDPKKCQACMICARNCPVQCIAGGKDKIHVIDQEQCIKCGTCLKVCPARFGAVAKVPAGEVPPPIPEEDRELVRK